jgi:hypothetical protein
LAALLTAALRLARLLTTLISGSAALARLPRLILTVAALIAAALARTALLAARRTAFIALVLLVSHQ